MTKSDETCAGFGQELTGDAQNTFREETVSEGFDRLTKEAYALCRRSGSQNVYHQEITAALGRARAAHIAEGGK